MSDHVPVPERLGERGRRFWSEVVELRVWGPGDLLLLEEACRIADRLDKLDRLLRGESEMWARVYSRGGDEPIDLHLDDALGEARQQASVLRQIVAQLNLPAATDVAKPGGSVLDQIAAARAARRASGRPDAAVVVGAAGQ